MRAPRFTARPSPASTLALTVLAAALLSACEPAENVNNRPEYVAQRIQKVGTIELAAVSSEPKSGEEVYKAVCAACHTAGALGAPKVGDAGAWAARAGKGYDALLTSALKGKGSMPAQGGGAFSDFEVGRAVVHMVNGSGGKLAEPKKP